MVFEPILGPSDPTPWVGVVSDISKNEKNKNLFFLFVEKSEKISKVVLTDTHFMVKSELEKSQWLRRYAVSKNRVRVNPGLPYIVISMATPPVIV